jgi:hypothetical protein
MIRFIKSFIKLFISGLITAIFLNYLITGFVDIVYNVNSLLIWVKQSGIGENLYRFFGGR